MNFIDPKILVVVIPLKINLCCLYFNLSGTKGVEMDLKNNKCYRPETLGGVRGIL